MECSVCDAACIDAVEALPKSLPLFFLDSPIFFGREGYYSNYVRASRRDPPDSPFIGIKTAISYYPPTAERNPAITSERERISLPVKPPRQI